MPAVWPGPPIPWQPLSVAPAVRRAAKPRAQRVSPRLDGERQGSASSTAEGGIAEERASCPLAATRLAQGRRAGRAYGCTRCVRARRERRRLDAVSARVAREVYVLACYGRAEVGTVSYWLLARGVCIARPRALHAMCA